MEIIGKGTTHKQSVLVAQTAVKETN